MKPAASLLSALAILVAPLGLGLGLPPGSTGDSIAFAQPAPPVRAPRKPPPRLKPGAKPEAKPAGDDKTPRRPTVPRKVPLLPKAAGQAQPGKVDAGKADGGKKDPADLGDTARRWSGTTPEETLDLALARARAAGPDAVGGLLVAAAMHSDVGADRVPRGLAEIGRATSSIAEDARWLAKLLGARGASKPWPGLAAVAGDVPAPDRDGLVENLAILGPFQDTGGGLARREGPEASGQRWADPAADYSWGTIEVRWRRALPGTVTARGVPLDLYVSPRNETCTYLASKIDIPAGHQGPVHVHVASSGAVRLLWNGNTIGASDEQHASMVLDRMQRAIDAPAGAHLLALKVCSSSVADAGRVRLRLSNGAGKPLAFRTSSDLSGVAEPPSPRPTPGGPAGVAAASRGVPTALELASANEGKGIDHAVLAALARTVGGADNAQSPRAPGLLDRVARAPDASADQLAMAGWLSPFGSNKSGWLNLARAKAHAEGDRGAESFAQRALIASSLSGAMGDWAIAASREEPFASAKDASARHLRALTTMRSGGSGTIQSALEQLLAIERDARGKAGLAVWRDIQRTARGDADLALRAARRLVSLGQTRDPSFVRAHLPEGAEMVERVVAASLVDQRSSGDVVQLGRELARLGRHAWAREVFEVAVRLAPNDADAWSGLAEALTRAPAGTTAGEGAPAAASAEGPAARAQRARAALRRVLALRPGDARAKAELAAREGSDAEGGLTGERDERWIAAPASFLARAKAAPAKKGEVFSRQLHWVRAVTLHPDARVSQMIQYAREIVVEPRTQAELFERDIPEEGDEAELLIARVHRKDGTVVEPEERGSGSRAYVRWPELHAGDVVEVALRTWTGPIGRRGDPPFYFIDYVGSTDSNPVLYNEVVIDSPAAAPLAVEVLNGRADRATEERDGGRLVQRFIWDAPPALPEEPLGPRLGDALPLVVGSSYRSWDEFLGWYRGAVQGFTEPDDQVRRIAADLTKGKRTREEKVEALFEFVADDIRYVNYVSGEWWLPNRPQQLLARRQGDCDDKAMLLVSLLRSVGIEATPVLVQTRYTAMPSVLAGSKAAIPLFDHGIAYLPGEGGRPGMWLDATSPQSRIGTLPSMDARARALMVERGPAKIIETPPSSPSDHGVFAEWQVTLEPTGAASLVATERHRGDSAFELRTVLSEADARGQWVERYLQSRLPTVEVDPAVAFDPKAGVLTYQAKSAGLGRREGEEIAVPLAGTRTYTSAFAPLPAARRTLPVVLPPGLAPSEQRYRSTLVAPKGWRFAALPPGGKVDGGALGRGSLTVEAGPRPNTVVVDLTVTLDQSTIPLAEYAAFRDMLQRIDALTHRVVRLVPEGAPVPKR